MKKYANLLLLLFLQIYHQVHCGLIYIRPQEDKIRPLQPCQTLMEYVNSPTMISSNTTLVMLPGNHALSARLSFTKIANFTIMSSSDFSTSSITCSDSGKLILNTIQDAKIHGLSFIGCGGNAAQSIDRLTIENSHFIDGSLNPLTDAARAWMISESPSVIVSNCSFINNRASGRLGEGGAMSIEHARNLTIANCTFSDNQITGDSHREGGALFIAATNTLSTITGCTFNRNQVNESRGNGGALYIYARNSSVIISGCNFNDNKINGSWSEGGAVYINARNSTSIISRSTFANNKLKPNRGEGAALFISGAMNSTSIISDCTFVGNQADGSFGAGGAVYISSTTNSTSIIDACTFANNQVAGSHSDGGAIYIRGATNSMSFVSECMFMDNQLDNSHSNGGAMFITASTNSTSAVSLCTFINNQIDKSFGEGGALFVSCTSNSSSTVKMCAFANNQINGSHGEGGAMFASGTRNSTIFVSECLFMNNQVNDSHGDGGALFVSASSNSTSTVSGCGFMDNQVNGPFGGGGALFISSTRNSTYTTNMCTFTNNQVNGSHGNGGALFLSATDDLATINECNFINNQAVGSFGEGGALYISTSSNLTIKGCTLNLNRVIGSFGQGGAIYIHSPAVDLMGCSFTNNEANENGGAVYINGQSSFGEITVFQCQFLRSIGGAIYGNNVRKISVHTSTFKGNLNGGRAAVYVAIRSRNLAAIQDLDSLVIVSQSSFNGNDGAIESTNIKQISIHSSNFTNQTANLRVLRFQGTGLSDDHASIKECNFESNEGGVIYSHNISISVDRTTFSDNTLKTTVEGMVYVLGYNTGITLSNSIFRNNSAPTCGTLNVGYPENSTPLQNLRVSLISNIFSGNRATGSHLGGGVGCFESTTVAILNSTFSHNTANHNGGVFNANESTISIVDSIFTNNSAPNRGGVGHTINSSITVMDSLFNRNTAFSTGGIFSLENSDMTAKYTTILDNRAGNSGGVIYAYSISGLSLKHTFIRISKSRLSGNVALRGGILYAQNNTIKVFMDGNCLDFNNAADNGTFAALWNTTLTFKANDNIATPEGDIYACNGSVVRGGININGKCSNDSCTQTQSSVNNCITYDLTDSDIGRTIEQESFATCSVEFESESDKTNVYTAITVSLSTCGTLILLVATVAIIAGMVRYKKVKRNSRSTSNNNSMPQDNSSNEEKRSKEELKTYSYAKQIPGCNRAYYYEQVQETNSHQSGSYVNQASHEGIEMTTNIVYALTRKIETKTNVAYATTGRLH